MATSKVKAFERTHAAKGIKAAAFVLILGSVALAADQMFFVAPLRPPALASPTPAAVSSVAIDGFALPDNLRPTAADAVATAPTF